MIYVPYYPHKPNPPFCGLGCGEDLGDPPYDFIWNVKKTDYILWNARTSDILILCLIVSILFCIFYGIRKIVRKN
jgi:hypothetical protein